MKSRLQNDASSAIIYHLSPNNSLITASYTTTTNSSENNDSNPSIEIQGTLTAFYTSTIPTNSTGPVSSSNSDDIWNSQHPTPIILNKTILAQNVDCEPGMTITITTLDANGQAVVYSAVDMVVAPVPGALPARVTVGNDVGAVEMVLWFNGLEPVSVSLGMGNGMLLLFDLAFVGVCARLMCLSTGAASKFGGGCAVLSGLGFGRWENGSHNLL